MSRSTLHQVTRMVNVWLLNDVERLAGQWVMPVARIHRGHQHCRRAQGLAVPHRRGLERNHADQPMNQPDAWRMVRRRAAAAGIKAPIGCHTLRVTGITAYLENGGTIEHTQAMGAHESPPQHEAL